MAKIREESILLHGEDLTQCPKRKICFTKKCLGRPLPIKSPTFKTYLKQLETTHQIQDGLLFITNCEGCPIKAKCTSTCDEVNNWINRDSNPEPNLIYKENLENYNTAQELHLTIESEPVKIALKWDVLTEAKVDLVKRYLYANKDFRVVAREMGYFDESHAKYEYYAALTKLAEYSIMQDFLKKTTNLTDRQEEILNMIYFGKKSLTETAKYYTITKQAVSDMVKNVIKANRIKIPVFVRKVKGIPVYNIPEVLK